MLFADLFSTQEMVDRKLISSYYSAKLKSLEKPYLKTSRNVTVLHLKKFLCQKLELEKPNDVRFLLLCPSASSLFCKCFS